MNLWASSLFLAFIISTQPSKTTWTFPFNTFIFQVHVDSVSFKGKPKKKGVAVSSVEVVNAETRQVVQTLLPNTYLHESHLDSSIIVIFEDINFDGNVDVGLLNWTSTNIQKTYDFWAFNEDEQQFKRDHTLDTVWNPVFHPEHKVVYSSWRIGINEIGHRIFKYEPNHLTCLVKQVEYWGIDPEANGTLETTVLRNGQPAKTEFEIEDRNQGIEGWDVEHLLELMKL